MPTTCCRASASSTRSGATASSATRTTSRCTSGTSVRSSATRATTASRRCAASDTGCAAAPRSARRSCSSTVLLRLAVALASVRWRLTLTFVGLLAVLLAGLGTYAYLALRGSLIANRVAALQDDYNTARVIITRPPTATAPRGRQLCARAPTLVGRSVAQVVAATSGQAVDVVVYDPSLAIAATVPASGDLPHLDAGALRAVASTGRRSGAEVIANAGGGALVLGLPILVAGSVCGIAQMSTPMTPINNVLRDELVLVGLGGGAALLVALVAGLLLTGRTLRPLHRLTATAEQLAAGDLRARSRLSPRSDEVGALAQSFDNMADRIEESFAAQQESEAQVRRFIADASHELRTPVTALKGYIDVLRRGAGRDPEALDAALKAMGSEADRMRALVLDLLTLARIDAQRAIHLEDVNLNDAVGSALDEGVPGMPAVLELQFTSIPVTVRADRGSLATIVRNLLVNACKYAPGASTRSTTAG